MIEQLTTRNDPTVQDITCRAEPLMLRADTINEQERSVEAVLATDAAVTVFDFRSYEFIEERLLMDGVEIPRQMPLLNNHARYDIEHVLGSIRNIRVEGDQLIGRLYFAEGPADSPEERAWQKVRQGHLTDVSVGYKSTNFVDIPPGKTQRVAGRNFTAGQRTQRITTQWTPRETSVTPIGADQAAKMRAESGLLRPSTSPRKDATMPQALRQYLESIGLRSEANEADAWAFYRKLTGDQQQRADELRGDVAVPPAPTGETGGQRSDGNPPANPATPPEPARTAPPADSPAADPADIARRAVEDERTRCAEIRRTAPDWIPADVVERAINEGWDLNRSNREFLDWTRANRQQAIEGAPAGHVQRRLEGDAGQRALSAGLMHRTNQTVINSEFNMQRAQRLSEQDADLGDRYRTYSLVDLCREALRLEGRQVPHDREEMIRAAVSTTSLANVFTTSIHARLLAGYMEAADTTDWCSEEDLTNYQLVDRVALGKTGALTKVGRGGTAPHATIDDSKEQYQLARYAEQFVVDDIDIVNDNLGGIQQVPFEMGMAARNLRPDLVYSIVLANAALGADSVALFNATHANTDTNALSLANIGAGVTAMMKQTQGGKRLNIRPRYLIVPGDLEFSAKEFLQSDLILYGADDETKVGNKNVIKDLNLQLRVEGRIDASGVTDPNSGTAYTGSATNWYLFSAAGRTVVVGYLAGTGRRPSMRRFSLDRGQFGMGWDIQHTIGAKALDYRGCYRGNT